MFPRRKCCNSEKRMSPVDKKRYSASAVKVSFWFAEFRKVMQMLDRGYSMSEIRELNLRENIFSASTPLRAKQIFQTVSGRVLALDANICVLFLSSDLATQKLIALVAAMAYDELFFDFVYEVVREKMIMGNDQLTDSDIRVFFKEKQEQDERVARWTDATFVRLARCYKTMLYEAGVINKDVGARKIIPPIVDPQLQGWLEDHGMTRYAKALTGERS